MSKLSTLFISSALCLAITACGDKTAPNDTATDSSNPPIERDFYVSDIKDAGGNILGTVALRDLGESGTEVTILVSGISAGTHAMHFHEFGKCDAPDFKSSGGHYNPSGVAHGHKTDGGPHAGDMMNIEIGDDMAGTFTVTNARVSINGTHGLPALRDSDGTALIIHAGADDYESQPSGAAGPRIGCAVIN